MTNTDAPTEAASAAGTLTELELAHRMELARTLVFAENLYEALDQGDEDLNSLIIDAALVARAHFGDEGVRTMEKTTFVAGFMACLAQSMVAREVELNNAAAASAN